MGRRMPDSMFDAFKIFPFISSAPSANPIYEVMRMDSADWFEVFRETGEPMAYLLFAAAERLEAEEEEILPSA